MIVIMFFLMRSHPTNEKIYINIHVLDLRLLKNVNRGVSFTFPDAAVCFTLDAGFHYISLETCHLLVLTLTLELRSNEIDWSLLTG